MSGLLKTKTCTKCGSVKSQCNFSTESYKGGSRVRPDCKECRAAYHRAHHAKPDVKRRQQSYMNGYQNRHRKAKYEKLRQLKESKPCADCNMFYPSYVMDYDHLDPVNKIDGIGYLVSTAHSWAIVEAEIAKCELVCANCHRLRTYHGVKCKQGRRVRHHISILNEIKTSWPCLDCGGHFKPSQMDFDHFDTTNKTANISLLVGKPSQVLTEELRKCHLVCANCHRIREATGIRVSPIDYGVVSDFLRLLKIVPYPPDKRATAPRCKRGPYLDRPAFRPWHNLAGTMYDHEIARKFGMSSAAVANYRRRHHVPAFDPEPGIRAPKFKTWHTLAGAISDAEIARRTGLDSSTVLGYRRKMGIPAFTKIQRAA